MTAKISREDQKTAHGQSTVLVVDDEPSICTMATRILERGGFRVLSARNGQEALHIQDEHRDEIVAVLLDMTMPVMDGMTAFPQLRKRKPDLAVLFTSGYTEADWSGLAENDTRIGFLHKPYSSADLISTLRQMLSRA